MKDKTVTLHDIELDAGQGLQHGHLVAEFYLNSKDEAELSNPDYIIFQPFGNNGEELPEQVISEDSLLEDLKERFLTYAEEVLR